MKTLYLDSIAGIAGDMFTASFIDAGLVSISELKQLAQQLNIAHLQLEVSKTKRAHMQATHITVTYDQHAWNKLFLQQHQHEHVPYIQLNELILTSKLPDSIKVLAQEILATLATAEAHCHGVQLQDVVFHEIGTADSLMDIVMAAYCIHQCQADAVIASPIKLGYGSVTITHGTQPVPPPVSAALVVNMQIAAMPAVMQTPHIELSTPTGLAILKTLKPKFSNSWPQGKVLNQGYGAGSKDLGAYPNLFRIVLLETAENTLPYDHDQVIEMHVNYDDTSPEHLAWTCQRLFDYGALDVWQTMAVGKKGRVMIILSAIIPTSAWTQCADFILKHTPTFGLRYQQLDRLKLYRHMETRDTAQGPVRIKVGCDNNHVKMKEKIEFADVAHHLESRLNSKESTNES